MSTLKKYKREAKKMFFVSVKKDIDQWNGGPGDSDYYIRYDDTYFMVERDRWLLIRSLNLERNGSKVKLCLYLCIIPSDIKVWWYVLKLKRYFRKLAQDEKNSKEIEYLKNGVEELHTNFLKEIRKEKLIQIDK